MKYQVPVRWLAAAARHDVSVVDERGRPAFTWDGAAVADRPASGGASGGVRVLTFRDRRGEPLGFITRRQVPGGNGGTAFDVYHGDDLQAVVRRDGCGGERCRFMVDGPGPDDLHAEGDLAGREYRFTREGLAVGRVSRSMAGGADRYGVEVGRGEDEVLMLGCVAVIDLCCQPDAEGLGARLAG